MAAHVSGNSGSGRGQSATTGCSPSLTDLSALQTRLGHGFKDAALLRRALTHASADSLGSNERLEFLGDRVLGLVLAERLHALYPLEPEGVLALKFNALARKEACAAAAEAAGLSEDLILANAEEGSGGRKKAVILAGACEAIIAALYLDGGYEAARQFIERFWSDQFEALGADMRDPKTQLQEWAQGRKRGPRDAPVYKQVRREGPDHAPRFSVEVSVTGEDSAIGEGSSKREAEQAAAKVLLKRLKLWNE
ncbi:MAG: ribonuclease III [Proteobacteria bacterium]|nr:ribonuclease III [Pseudomonadota bacterium]